MRPTITALVASFDAKVFSNMEPCNVCLAGSNTIIISTEEPTKGPGPKPLDSSISLKSLLETRLESESFETLEELLGFQVLKLFM